MNFLILLIYPDIFLHTKAKKVLIIWYNHISEVFNMTNKYKKAIVTLEKGSTISFD